MCMCSTCNAGITLTNYNDLQGIFVNTRQNLKRDLWKKELNGEENIRYETENKSRNEEWAVTMALKRYNNQGIRGNQHQQQSLWRNETEDRKLILTSISLVTNMNIIFVLFFIRDSTKIALAEIHMNPQCSEIKWTQFF